MSHPTTLPELFEHIRHYEPLVSATYDPWFNEAIEREQRSQAQSAAYEARIKELESLLNTPEFHDFLKGVPLEAAHQVERWGSEHDAGKSCLDWFWLIGYLAQRIVEYDKAGNRDKALHHCVTTAAALMNWHAALEHRYNGKPYPMVPGHAPTVALESAALQPDAGGGK